MSGVSYTVTEDDGIHTILVDGKEVFTFDKLNKTLKIKALELKSSLLPLLNIWRESPPAGTSLSFIKKCIFLVSTLAKK